MPKLIYFTAGEAPTVGEEADIAKFNTAADSPLTVLVRRADRSQAYGSGVEEADYVAGTVPTEYADVPVADPDAPPIAVGGNAAIVYDDGTVEGVSVTINGGSATVYDVTVQIVDGVITAIAAVTPA